MDLKVQSSVLKYFTKMFDRSSSVEPALKLLINKPLCPYKIPELMPLPRITPEEAGIDSSYIAAFLNELTAENTLDMHGVMIVKDGKIVCDAEFGAYKSCFWHAEHSLSKSVTSMAIGMLIEEKKLSLDDKVTKILEKKLPPIAQLTHKAITVRHLLTMTSGVIFSESGAIVEENWLRSFFESYLRTEPGKVFHYNSMNTFILSCIVRELSGVGLREYLKPRLFDPLGITVMHWETAPDGNEIGGWGLYLRREDAAKLANLYLEDGMWNGRRIISAEWIKASTAAQIAVSGNTGDFDYGYQIWSGRKTKSFLFNGMFGQDTISFPDTKTIVVSNAGIEQIFQQSVYYDIVQKYFSSPYYADKPLKRSRKSQKKLASALTAISNTSAEKPAFLSPLKEKNLPDFLMDAMGKTFAVRKKNEKEIIKTTSITGTGNLGLLPLIEQIMRNRYTKGIVSFAFSRNRNGYDLNVTEGDKVCSLPFFPGRTLTTVLRLSDTEYHAAVASEIAYDEDGRGVLKLRISFLEISGSRFIKIFFEKDSLEIKMKELPGMGLVKLAADTFGENIKDKKAIADIVSKIDTDMLYCKLKNTIEPEIRLYCEK